MIFKKPLFSSCSNFSVLRNFPIPYKNGNARLSPYNFYLINYAEAIVADVAFLILKLCNSDNSLMLFFSVERRKWNNLFLKKYTYWFSNHTWSVKAWIGHGNHCIEVTWNQTNSPLNLKLKIVKVDFFSDTIFLLQPVLNLPCGHVKTATNMDSIGSAVFWRLLDTDNSANRQSKI